MTAAEVILAMGTVAGIITALVQGRNSARQADVQALKDEAAVELEKQKSKNAEQQLYNETIDNNFVRLNKEIDRLDKSNSDKQVEIERLSAALGTMRRDGEQQAVEMSALRVALATEKQTNAGLQVRITDLEKRNTALEVRVTELTAERDAALGAKTAKPGTGPLAG